MFDDLFGSRPRLVGLIQADSNSQVYLLEVLAPLLGAWVATRAELLGHLIPAGLVRTLTSTPAVSALTPSPCAAGR